MKTLAQQSAELAAARRYLQERQKREARCFQWAFVVGFVVIALGLIWNMPPPVPRSLDLEPTLSDLGDEPEPDPCPTPHQPWFDRKEPTP